MKHAYLIMAHNEFEVLQHLVTMLDDPRNEIFIHYDAKVKVLPILNTLHSDIHISSWRIAVRWGHVSQIAAEYVLFEDAYRRPVHFDYFHVISGVHMPLCTQDRIHDFFDKGKGREFIPRLDTTPFQADLKMNRYNFFMRYFAHKNKVVSRMAQISWGILQRMQRCLSIRRYHRNDWQHGSNWVSITEQAVAYLLSIRTDVLNRYRYTLCGDEFFVPTELTSSGLNFQIDYSNSLLKHDIDQANAKVYDREDYSELILSDCLFARKFSLSGLDLVVRIIQAINSPI